MKRSQFLPQSVLCLTCFLLSLLISASSIQAQPRKVTWEDLEQLSNGKKPKNSTKELGAGMLSTNMLKIEVQTPRYVAARRAKIAKEQYIKLDSAVYNPELFNTYIQLYAYNLATSEAAMMFSPPKPEDIIQIERAVILIEEEVIEPDSVVFHRQNLQNAYGADWVSVDATFFYPIELFTGKDDIKIVIFSSKGKDERKLKKKHIKKLE